MTPDQLISAIREELDRRERLARAAGWHEWDLGIVYGTVIAPNNGKTVARDCREYDAEFIAFHDPSSVLTRVEADRKLLAEYEETRDAVRARATPAAQAAGLFTAVRILAHGLGIDTDKEINT